MQLCGNVKEIAMKPVHMFCMAVLFATAPVNAAQGQTAPIEDLHCLLTMGALQTQADENAKNTGVMGSMYFLGKIMASQPDIDLGDRLASEAAKLRGQPTQALFQRCLQEFNARSQQLIASSNRISAALN